MLWSLWWLSAFCANELRVFEVCVGGWIGVFSAGFTIVRWLRVTPAEQLGAVLFDRMKELCFSSTGEVCLRPPWLADVLPSLGKKKKKKRKKAKLFFDSGEVLVPWRVPDTHRVRHDDSRWNRDDEGISLGWVVFLLNSPVFKHVAYYTLLDSVQSFEKQMVFPFPRSFEYQSDHTAVGDVEAHEVGFVWKGCDQTKDLIFLYFLFIYFFGSVSKFDSSKAPRLGRARLRKSPPTPQKPPTRTRPTPVERWPPSCFVRGSCLRSFISSRDVIVPNWWLCVVRKLILFTLQPSDSVWLFFFSFFLSVFSP